MPTVRNTIHLPDGEVARKGRALIQLIASTDVDHAPGWYATESVAILGTRNAKVDPEGRWQCDLVGNADIDPENTVYRITETVPTHHNPVVYYIDVPTAPATYWVADILAVAPTDLPAQPYVDPRSLLTEAGETLILET